GPPHPRRLDHPRLFPGPLQRLLRILLHPRRQPRRYPMGLLRPQRQPRLLLRLRRRRLPLSQLPPLGPIPRRSRTPPIQHPVTSLTLAGAPNAWTSALDLTTHTLILQPAPATKASALATLTDQIAFGRSHTNAGIIDSTLPQNFAIALLDNAITNFTTFASQP